MTETSPERLTFFSDAVIAIAMTLLAIELPLPTGESDHELWRSFGALMGEHYLPFALSFVVIGAYWSAHHRLFQHVRTVGPGLIPRNMVFLFAIVAQPYATRLLGEEGHSQVATVVYATVVAVTGLSLLALLLHVRRQDLATTDVPWSWWNNMAWGVLVSVPAFLISIPIAFVDTSWAKRTWFIGWLVFGLTIRLLRVRMTREDAA